MCQVTVIIPTYNRRALVQQAIDSVLAQTYTDYEIIVVDDGSTDGTGEALAARYGERIRYFCQENKGRALARNLGIAEALGEYVSFLDSDDLFRQDELERHIQGMADHPEIDLGFTSYTTIPGMGTLIRSLICASRTSA